MKIKEEKKTLPVTLIYLEDELVLSKKVYASWRQIQEEHEGYKASLSPMPIEEVMEFFRDDFGADECQWPFSKEQLMNFIDSDQQMIAVKVS